MANKCTIKDVAKACGVSAYTVSRAMNDKPDISPQTKEAILQKARSMGYVVNRGAKSLKSGKSEVVGIAYDDFKNPFYNVLIEKISLRLFQNGYNVVLFYDFDSISHLNTHFLKRILASNVDGIISLVPVTKNAAIFNENWSKPIVQVGSPSKEAGVDSIYSDDLSGAKELTKALLSKGHRQIGFISSAPDMIPGLRRIKGYLDALEEAGHPYGESYVHYLTPSSLTVEGATQNLVKRGCDAIIYFNDLSALMGKRFLETIHRPDVEVAGFDGIERYTPTASHIPSAHLDLEKMAEEAVDVLLLRLKGEKFPPVDKMFPVSVHT